MKVYISGMITGLSLDVARKRFEDAETILKKKGYTTVNPFNNGLDASAEWDAHMKVDIKMLLDCDCIYMLDGWENSRGAMTEHYIAQTLGMGVVYEPKKKRVAIEDMQGLMDSICAWSDQQFSNGVFTHERALPITHHLKKEVDELIEGLIDGGSNPTDIVLINRIKMEYADCLMLLLDSASHFGLSAADLYKVCSVKLRINKGRKWGVPDENGVVEHIRG